MDDNKTNDVIPDVLFYIGDNLFYKNQPKMYSFQMIHLFYGQNEHFLGKNGKKSPKLSCCILLDTLVSGSPIIQDGKLIGAVTHVLVNDPTTGYGIFIQNMLDAAA